MEYRYRPTAYSLRITKHHPIHRPPRYTGLYILENETNRANWDSLYWCEKILICFFFTPDVDPISFERVKDIANRLVLGTEVTHLVDKIKEPNREFVSPYPGATPFGIVPLDNIPYTWEAWYLFTFNKPIGFAEMYAFNPIFDLIPAGGKPPKHPGWISLIGLSHPRHCYCKKCKYVLKPVGEAREYVRAN